MRTWYACLPSGVGGAVAEIVEWPKKPVEVDVTTVGLVKVVRLRRLPGPVVEDSGSLVGPLGRIADAPFSEESGLVACTPQATGHGVRQLLSRESLVEIVDAVAAWILSGQQVGPADCADRGIDEAVLEDQPLLCQTVKIRRVDGVIPGIPHGIVPLVVGEDHHDVGPLRSSQVLNQKGNETERR